MRNRLLSTTSMVAPQHEPRPAVTSTVTTPDLSLRLPQWRDRIRQLGLDLSDAQLAAMVGNAQWESGSPTIKKSSGG